MADILCGYTADRDETLVAYLYGDIDPAQRAAFDAHIATCERCRQELAELRGVRGRLGAWTTPELAAPLTLPAPMFTAAPGPPDRWQTWRAVPVWAQVAAALFVLGVSAGVAGAIAHLDVRYSHEGLTVRTGWSRPDPVANVPAIAPGGQVQTAAAPATPWTGDLDALERRLRAVIRESSAAAASTLAARSEAAPAATDAQVLRKVRTLLEDSERKQRNELALRIAQVVEEFDAKRGSDLANIRSMKTIQNATVAEIVRQQQGLNLQQQGLNLLTRTSMQK